MATFDLTPDEANSILERLDRWYDGSTGAPVTDAPIVPVEPVVPVAPAPAPTPPRVGARTQVRRLVASLRGR